LSFTFVKNLNGVSGSVERYLSNSIYYFDASGYSEYYISGDDTTSFLNENTSLVVSLVTSIGDYTFGGGALLGINPPDSMDSGYEESTNYDYSYADSIISIVQWSFQKGTSSADGLTDVAILPGASHRNEAKITVKRDEGVLPKEFQLNQNYPNPFNPTTIITFALPKNASVSVKVYDMLGREVKTLLSDEMSAGIHAVEWRGDDNGGTRASSGTYLYRITADDFVSTKKMILMK
jgi:flagellar hook assembly protein FlgD